MPIRRVVMFALVLAVVQLWGCAKDRLPPSVHTPYPGVIMDVRDDSLAIYAPFWQKEVARRFPNAVVVLCHGGAVVEDQWITLDNPGQGYPCEAVSDLVVKEQAEYPGRTVVLLCCNTGHFLLHGFKNVYYSPSTVWCLPDRSTADPSVTNSLRTQKLDDPDDAELPPATASLFSPTPQDRWASAPDTVGNVFEFLSAE